MGKIASSAAAARIGSTAEAEQVVARGRALLGPEANTHHMAEALRGIAPPDDSPA